MPLAIGKKLNPKFILHFFNKNAQIHRAFHLSQITKFRNF